MKDRARYNKGKRLESHGRNDVNEKVSKGRKRKEKELADREREREGKVEGLYGGKEQETFKKEAKQSVETRGLSKAVRKVMGRGDNWEDEWEEEEGLVIGDLDRRMVAGERSIGEEALVKEWRVTRIESTALAWVSQNCIAPELSQIQPCSSYLDSAKCNLDENTKAALVHAR